MLIECVSEANQALYTEGVESLGAVPNNHPAMYPAYPRSQSHQGPPGAGGGGPAPRGNVRGRYIKQWLDSLYPANNNSRWAPSQYAWNAWRQHHHQQQQQHHQHQALPIKQENPVEFPNPEKKVKDGSVGPLFQGQSAFLGPNIWDKTMPYTEDFNLEYMDLDEFLLENCVAEGKGSMNNSMPSPQNSISSGMSGGGGRGQGSPAPLQMSPPHVQLSPMHNPIPQLNSVLPPSPRDEPAKHQPRLQQQSPQPKPSQLERYLSTDADAQSPSPPQSAKSNDVSTPSPINEKPAPVTSSAPSLGSSMSINIPYTVNSSDLALAILPAVATGRTDSPSSHMYHNEDRMIDDEDDDEDDDDDLDDEASLSSFPEGDLALVRLAGQKDFDPRRRQFTEDELRPQPMIKKSRKVYVPEGQKDDKYWARRKKNNTAAKRSRDARRVKENQIAMRANFLEREASTLREELAVQKEENNKLRLRLEKYEGKP